jgi:hypothetical protein
MNRCNNRTFLKLEHLEQRDMPSAGIPGTDHIILSGHDPVSSMDGPIAEIRLRRIVHDAVTITPGQGKGTFTTAGVPIDAGRDYLLTGTGNFLNLTNAKITGSVHSVGFILHGHAGGTITFTNAKGSVTLALVGPQQPGFSPLPTKFTYTVEKGTGAYAHMTGAGTLTLTLHQTAPHSLIQHGTFTLQINSYEFAGRGGPIVPL